MTAAREDRTVTVHMGSDSDSRRAWTRPALERIEAGSAELGSEIIEDEGVTKS